MFHFMFSPSIIAMATIALMCVTLSRVAGIL